MSAPPSPADHRRAELLRIASRTFAVGIERLPARLREPVQTAYLLLRVSDYLEDSETLPEVRKVALLRAWADALDAEAPSRSTSHPGATPDPGAVFEAAAAGASSAPGPAASDFGTLLGAVDEETPDAAVAREYALVLQALRALPEPRRGIVQRHVGDTTRGMARWVERGPDFEDEADLDDYMHEVAGRVGWLLTDLFAAESAEVATDRARMNDLGRSFGLGLQTVNVLRGLHQDHHRGWLYVPRTWLRDAGLSGPELFEPAYRQQALAVLERLTSKAARHLDDAVHYTLALPRRLHGVRVFCALPLFFALRTLALTRSNPDVFTREVKMTRPEVARIVARTQLLAWSNTWVRGAAARLSRPGR
ncbi:MAG: squalene/phytoene synthase family protein [Gemmatimonadota bacterium]